MANDQEQHTPGPWEVTELSFEDGRGYIIEDGEGHVIATAPVKEIADLIAAAPAMLRALAEIRGSAAAASAYDNPPYERKDFLLLLQEMGNAADAALAQARSQEPA